MRWRGRLTDHQGAPRSEGILVEASVVARLLGMRLLKLDATVVLSPADVTRRSAAPRVLPAVESRPAPHISPSRPQPAGRGLAEAVRHIKEGEELLAEARHDGASRR